MSNLEIIEANYAKATQGIKSQWLDAVSFEWYNYVVGLPLELEVTYLVVVFHNQIMNDGFHQYFVNGYGQFAEETISALSEIGAKTKPLLWLLPLALNMLMISCSKSGKGPQLTSEDQLLKQKKRCHQSIIQVFSFRSRLCKSSFPFYPISMSVRFCYKYFGFMLVLVACQFNYCFF